MEVREQVKGLIERLIQEIKSDGEILLIPDDTRTIKHDRTVTLKNYVGLYKQLSDIYPPDQTNAKLQNVRDNL